MVPDAVSAEKSSPESLPHQSKIVIEIWVEMISKNRRPPYRSKSITGLQVAQIVVPVLQQMPDLAYEDRNHIVQEWA